MSVLGAKEASDKVERLGWTLAAVLKRRGDGKLLDGLSRKVALRSAHEVALAKSGEWRVIETGLGQGIEVPTAWTMEEREIGRYHHAILKPETSEVTVVCEVGQHDNYHENSTIDWRGTEKEIKRKYGTRYKRLRLGDGETLSGMPASVWEYELRKPGEPPLRKICVGRRAGYASFVVICTAPSSEFKAWKPYFSKSIDSFGES
ncbi:MAG: hypothetical protein EOP06_30330 [Proteobacteria bacterium]|nr:MAG: hypothetical protein EOP06_30330 [Pseudomonadota bacterium]